MSITVAVSGATIMCDTPGCGNALTIAGMHEFAAMELAAPAHHWVDDQPECGGARRCPQCAGKGWPWCLPVDTSLMPDPGLYADLDALYAWCDQNVQPLAQPEPDVVEGVVVELEPAQEAAMVRLEDVWDEHQVTAELPAVLEGS